MANYSINKGVNKPAEFKGLQSQYLLIFAGGLLGSFVLFIILYLAGVNQWVCIFLGVILALLVIYTTLSLSKKYGRFGLMKQQATETYPRRIINRRSIPKLFSQKGKELTCETH
jgi:membrane protein YdbS with pleckstrin-like domain